jgi:alcohol dehydrogenase (NADP+)
MEASLRDLGTGYIDLFLVHWPHAFKRGDTLFPHNADGKLVLENIDYVDTWKAMEKLPKDKVKAIGISNFNKTEVERVLEAGSIVCISLPPR